MSRGVANFTLRVLADSLTPIACLSRFLALQRSGNYSELRIIQRGRGQKFRIVGYRWPSKAARRKWKVGKAANPKLPKPIQETGQNPTPKRGATPNQVLFGNRGKTMVGWINAEKGNLYQIAYKVGPRTKTLWRPKSSVKFVLPRRRNICPTLATSLSNPTHPIKAAVKISRAFFGAAPRRLRSVDVRWPKALVFLGRCARVDYVTDKWGGKMRQYFHDFGSETLLFTGDAQVAPGKNILLIVGNFNIKPAGIVG